MGVVCGTRTPPITDDRIPKIMIYGEKDVNDEMKMDREHFIGFYRDKAFSNIGAVRANITSFGYSADLRKIAGNEDPDNINQQRKSAEDMPRYKLTNNEKYFNVLLDLTTLHPEIKNRSKGLFEACCTRHELHNSVLNIGLDSTFSWANVSKYSDFMKIYTLDIINNIIV